MKPKNFQMPRSVQIDKDRLCDTYGLFTVQPLERGFGTTIGNMLRRVLLASIEGAAVKAIRIEGVQHEFAVVEGVVEDVAEIVLNLKEVFIRLFADEDKTLRITVKGPRNFVASDLQVDSSIEILNPDKHIATLEKDSVLDMEVTVGQGMGYVLAEENKTAEQSMGTIPMDSAYSPVRKVRYDVEKARVGQQIDYDKLTLEVWTNGVVRPDDAVSHAAKILKDHLELFVSFEEEYDEEPEEVVDEEAQRIANLLKMPVEELELSVRSANCLKAADIHALEDLIQKSEVEMLKFRNFGRKSLNELTAILEGLGLSFGMDVSKFKGLAVKPEHIGVLEEDY